MHISFNRIAVYLTIALVVPLGTLMYMAFPHRVFGKNLWVALPLVMALVVWLRDMFLRRELENVERVFLLHVMLFAVILWLRQYIYHGNEVMLSFRWVISPFLYAFCVKYLIERGYQGALLGGLVSGAVFVAFIIYANRAFFPDFNTGLNLDTGEPHFYLGLTRDGIMGASVSDHLMLPVAVVILFLYHDRRIGSPAAMGALLFICGASLFSNTRLVMFCVVLFLVAYIYIAIERNRSMLWSIVPLVIAAVALSTKLLFNRRWISEGDGGRLEKYINGLGQISESFLSLLIGVSPHDYTYGGRLHFSDNGFIQVAYSSGLPVAVTFFALMIMVLRWGGKNAFLVLLSGYGALTLFFTNAISWESWGIFYVISFCLIRHMSCESRASECPRSLSIQGRVAGDGR